MPFMGFEPMTLSQNILQPIIYQRKKALKFCQAVMGYKPMTLSRSIFHLIKYQNRKPIKFCLSWNSNPSLYPKILSSS